MLLCRLFRLFNPNITTTSRYLNWPCIKSSPQPPAPSDSPHPTPSAPPTPATPPPVLHLQCGHTSCDLRVTTYEFVWDESDELDDSSSSESSTDYPSSSEEEASGSASDLQDTDKHPVLQDTGKSPDLQDTTEEGKGHEVMGGKQLNVEGVKDDDIAIDMSESEK